MGWLYTKTKTWFHQLCDTGNSGSETFLLWPSEVRCKTRSCLLRNVRQCYKLFINHWFMSTSLFSTEKFGLLDYQDDTNIPSQMNLWSFKIHLNLVPAKFEFDSVPLIYYQKYRYIHAFLFEYKCVELWFLWLLSNSKMKHKCSMPSKMLRHPKWHPFTKLLFNCLLTCLYFLKLFLTTLSVLCTLQKPLRVFLCVYLLYFCL